MRKSSGPSSGLPSTCPERSPSGRSTARGEARSWSSRVRRDRAKVLTLDQSSDDEANKRGRLAFFALPQGTERGRSLAVGDLDGDHRKDVIVTDPANAQVWVYLQTGHSGLSSGQTFPSLGNARTVRLAPLDGGGKDEVYVLSEQEKQIGRSVFDKGRLSFPTPISLTGEPAAMDVADLDGDKVRRDPLRRHEPKPGGEAFELRAVTRDRSGSFRATKWGEVESVSLPGVTAVPAAIKTLDINQDGQTDLLIFKDYGSPLLILGEKGGPPRPFIGSLGPSRTRARRA